MPEEGSRPVDRCISFGTFEFYPARRLLLDAGKPVRIGGRASDILWALVEKQGQVVSKQELLEQAWPNTFVEEGNLRVHVGALRRALGDGQGDRRFISNIAGRGYSFIAPVSSKAGTPEVRAPEPAGRVPDMPLPLARMVGRAGTIGDLTEQLQKHRFVSIVGPGGIGKTTVAVAVAERFIGLAKDGVYFVDFAPLTDPLLATSALAARLGVAVRSENPASALVQHLQEKNVLVVLDSCENVIEEAAVLAEHIFEGAENTYLLVTSRESLRVEGEHVYRLAPLPVPGEPGDLKAAEALAFPAVQLFVERAAASGGHFELSDRDAPLVAAICRRLDGIALAIEIAAGRVDAFGVSGLATLLNDRFKLLMEGRRTALPRHRTLSSTLDWSYSNLPDKERQALRRLAVFAGPFTMGSARSVLAATGISPDDAVDAIANLVGKSLVVADTDRMMTFYRLLDTTRAYGLFKMEGSNEREMVARSHASHYQSLLEKAQAGWETLPATEWLEQHRHLLDNARAALDWAFSSSGDVNTGIALTIAVIPLWFQLSLISECAERVDRALETPAANADPGQSIRLHAARAWALMQTKGLVRETEEAWTHVLDISEQQGDIDHQLRALWGLWASLLNRCELRPALTMAQRFSELATHAAAQDRLVGDRMIGYIHHLMGDQQEGRRYLESMLDQYQSPVIGAEMIRYVFDQRATARCFLARILWLQGFADQAMRLAESVVTSAIASKDVLSLCQVLVQAACPVALFVGDLAALERHVTLLLDQANRQSLDFWRFYGHCFSALLATRRGPPGEEIANLGAAVENLREIQYGVFYTMFVGEFAQALGRAGRREEGLAAIEKALTRCQKNGEGWYLAELLRIRGEILLQGWQPGAAEAAEQSFREALDRSEQQGTAGWRLRAATSMAKLYCSQRRTPEAYNVLSRVNSL